MKLIELDCRIASELDRRNPFAAIDAMCEFAPPEYLVWWGCLCSWSTWRPVPPKVEDESLSIASRWVFFGDDHIRQEAANRAQLPDVGVCKWLLNAVVNSGGSLATDGLSIQQPTPNCAGRFTLGFIHQLLSLQTIVNRTSSAETFVQFARQAIAEPLPRMSQSENRSVVHA